MLKTWYFSYSAFCLTGQWRGYSPLPPLATLLTGNLSTLPTPFDACISLPPQCMFAAAEGVQFSVIFSVMF